MDRGILNSSVWYDRDVRDVFITTLLMATLHETTEPMPQLEVNSLKDTGWSVPPGWYGLVEAAGVGIVARAGIDRNDGMNALVKMGEPEPESRDDDFDGRRLVRVKGGYIVLNYVRYLEKDHGSAERQKRYRLRKLAKQLETKGTDDAEIARLARGALRERTDET